MMFLDIYPTAAPFAGCPPVVFYQLDEEQGALEPLFFRPFLSVPHLPEGVDVNEPIPVFPLMRPIAPLQSSFGFVNGIGLFGR